MIALRTATLALLLTALACPGREPTDGEVAAREVAIGVAGAFSNDGFKLRDGCWQGHFAPHESRVIQVNLYAGNQYWFSLGATPDSKKVTISVYDETGKPMPVEPYTEQSKAAAGFAPPASGPYYLRIEEASGKASSFCLVYSYK